MAKGPTIDHIVQASGVSRSTVFRYFAGKQVRPSAAVAIARALELLAPPSSPPDREILLSIVPTYTRFRGYGEVLEGVLEGARDRGIAVRLDAGALGRPQGVVIVGKGPEDEDAESAHWAAQGVPCVLVNRIVDEPQRSWVAVDCRRAARQAVEHLLAQGCRRVALWSDGDTRVSRDKRLGYLDALEAGPGADPGLLFDASVPLEAAFDRAFDRAPGPDGWFAPDDETAIRVLSLAAARGLVVPRDLAVVGMNDITTAAHVVPPLTSVRLPFRAMGLAAVEVLETLARPRQRSVRILLDHELVVRESSRR